MIKVGIIGATGYAGGELARILMGHKDAEIVWYGSRSYIDKKYADVYQNMFQIVDANVWMTIWRNWRRRQMSSLPPRPRDSVLP